MLDLAGQVLRVAGVDRVRHRADADERGAQGDRGRGKDERTGRHRADDEQREREQRGATAGAATPTTGGEPAGRALSRVAGPPRRAARLA